MMAADDGFEPPQSKSKSDMLPLHQSALCRVKVPGPHIQSIWPVVFAAHFLIPCTLGALLDVRCCYLTLGMLYLLFNPVVLRGGIEPPSCDCKSQALSAVLTEYRGDGLTRTLSHGPAQSHFSGLCFLPCHAPRPTPTDKDALPSSSNPTPGQHLPGRFAPYRRDHAAHRNSPVVFSHRMISSCTVFSLWV